MVKDRIPRKLIEEWLENLKKKIGETEPLDKKGGELLRNIQAYIIDVEHFLQQGDYVKAWELVSFAWGLFEAGEELEKIKKL